MNARKQQMQTMQINPVAASLAAELMVGATGREMLERAYAVIDQAMRIAADDATSELGARLSGTHDAAYDSGYSDGHMDGYGMGHEAATSTEQPELPFMYVSPAYEGDSGDEDPKDTVAREWTDAEIETMPLYLKFLDFFPGWVESSEGSVTAAVRFTEEWGGSSKLRDFTEAFLAEWLHREDEESDEAEAKRFIREWMAYIL